MVLLSPRAAAKRGQIAGAARRLFLAHGYAATSMDAVTAEAGVSKQTLYVYFPTKLDLLGDVVASELGRLDLASALPTGVRTLPELRATLLDFAEGFTAALLVPETVAILRLVLGEAFHMSDVRESFREALPGRLLRRATELFALADERGIIHAPHPDLTARLFVGPLMTFVALDGFLGAGDCPQPSAQELAYFVDVLLESVAVPGLSVAD